MIGAASSANSGTFGHSGINTIAGSAREIRQRARGQC